MFSTRDASYHKCERYRKRDGLRGTHRVRRHPRRDTCLVIERASAGPAHLEQDSDFLSEE
eukprot:6174745-Pleurochrysis_carterae.AAC.1